MYEIFELNIKKFDYSISHTVIEKLKAFFNNSVAHKDKNFGNARFVFFEKTTVEKVKLHTASSKPYPSSKP